MTPSRSLSFAFWALWTLSAARSASSIPWPSPRSLLALSRRQSGIPPVPPQCATICDPVNTILETNTCTPSECCTTSFETNYFSCITCVLGAANATNSSYTLAQGSLDTIVVDCAAEGITLPELTLPGQNPNRTLPSLSLSGSLSLPKTNSQQITITALPSLSTPAASQQTFTAPPTSSTGPATPTTNAAVHCSGRLGVAVGLLSAIWAMS
ncbi:hypothetical protein K438DRAFT_1807624 [Mycena galopus ATCC 62051]|nr:hypothetical protein K438DRAFT_1807624 [Mycena galopus ATCC 62051]